MALLENRFLRTAILLVVALHSVDCMRKNNGRRGGRRQAGGKSQASTLVTCPGFPGYCSESYPGDTCLVVCARGRNNVPECQEDGTWTDVPRCVEHEPGIEEQVPGVCPGVPGYCSLDLPGGLCTFECPVGPPIRSSCTPDGTWDPYPTCFGDPRETQDGCDPCPGPNGAPRNRTAEAGGGAGGRSGSNNRKNGGGSKISGGGSRSNGGGSRNNGGGHNGGSSRSNGGGNRNGNRRNSGGNKSNRRNGGASRNSNQQPRSNSNKGKAGNRNGSGSSGGGGGGKCPGDVLEACIDVCPGFSARVFSACVGGCAKRCPGKK